MAFSFAQKSPAPAPAFGAAPAPAFGAAPAPAPAAGGFGGFGAAPAAAPAFGAAPAPAASGFGGFGGFGSPAPAAAGSFGAPAPAAGLFGAAPAGGLGFGAAPAPASGGLFGAPAAAAAPQYQQQYQQQQQQQPPPSSISTQTPYSQLPPQVKQAIDSIHDQMMKHKRSMAQVQTMAPVLLREPTQPAATVTRQPLAQLFYDMKRHMDDMEINLQACGREVMRVKSKYETTTTQSIVHGIWPMEALASRKGIKLPITLEGNSNNNNNTINYQIRQSLELQAAHVDRLEKIPSPYMWQTLDDMEVRLTELRNKTELLHLQLVQRKALRELGVASVVQSQTNLLLQVAQAIALLQHGMDEVRNTYRAWETTKPNVLDQQKISDLQQQQKRQEQVKMGYLKAAPAIAPAQAAPTAAGAFGAAPAAGGLFGAPAPAAGGLFGAPAPAAGGGIFGAPAAPAFGAAPAASAFGASSAFGAAPAAPAFGAAPAAPAFGAAPAAPAFGAAPTAPAFGAAPTAPAFGAAPAPAFGAAPPSTPAFGAAPAPAFGAAPAGGLFGAAPAAFGATTSSSKSKSKSRSSRRK